MSVAAFILFVIFVLTFVPVVKWYLKRADFIKKIDAIPGIKDYPLIGSTYQLFGVKREDIYQAFYERHLKYPEISKYWMGPIAQVEIKKAEYVEKILTTGKLHLQKAWYYKFIGEWLGTGLLTSDGEKWHMRRKIITPTFHFSILENFCEIFAEKSNILVKRLGRYADTGKSIDAYPFITKATLDIIADAAMGTQINAQDDTENDYVKAIYETAEMIVRRTIRPWLHPDFAYRRTGEGQKFAKCLSILHSFTKDVIWKKKQNRLSALHKAESDGSNGGDDVVFGKKKRLAFLDLLLEDELKLTDDDIREEVDTFMFEGHDTTTAGIAWALFLLGQHPKIQEDVYSELETIFKGSDRIATIQDFNDMKVLDRVIKETLRLYPSVPVIGRIASEDIQLDQYTIPAGCTINIQILNLHKDKRFFPNPDKFDPDRFLPENTVDRHPFAYIPFSAGARNCIGQKFAVYEEKSVLSAIIRNFRFKTVLKSGNVAKALELIFRPLDGVPLIFEKRIE